MWYREGLNRVTVYNTRVFILWFDHFSNFRAKFCQIFHWYFGPNDNTKWTFWNYLTYSEDLKKVQFCVLKINFIMHFLTYNFRKIEKIVRFNVQFQNHILKWVWYAHTWTLYYTFSFSVHLFPLVSQTGKFAIFSAMPTPKILL